MIEIRQLSTLEELDGALRLQQEVWGFADLEALPLRWFVVTSRIGGPLDLGHGLSPDLVRRLSDAG